jgi:hypothetical protein
MPLPELLDELFRLYRNYFGLIVGVALLVVLPGLIWTLVTGTYRLTFNSYSNLFPSRFGAQTTTLTSQQLSDMIGLILLGALGSIVIAPFSVGAVYRAVTDVALGRPATVGSVLRETLARYFPLLGLIALAALIFLAWLIAFVIGLFLIVVWIGVGVLGVWLLIRWWLTVAAMMAEDIGPINGLRRSWNLVGGMWWRTFGIWLVVIILRFVIGLALGFFFGIIAGFVLSGDLLLAVVAVGSTLLGAIVSPILTIGTVLLYFDLRVRKEGLDLDQLAQQTSPGPAPA